MIPGPQFRNATKPTPPRMYVRFSMPNRKRASPLARSGPCRRARHGVADRIAIAAAHAQLPAATTITEASLPGAPYDLVIGDLLYSQLL